MKVHNKKSLKEIRRALRQSETLAESLLWEKLRNRQFQNLKFNRQHSIGKYIVDFYCAELRLIIELDGEVHSDREQKQKDTNRDMNLTDMNYNVM